MRSRPSSRPSTCRRPAGWSGPARSAWWMRSSSRAAPGRRSPLPSPRHRRPAAPTATSRSDPAPMTRLLVVEHDADAPAGLLGGWATARGLAVSTVRLHAGDPLPPADACDAGGVPGWAQPASADAVPWRAAELALVARLLAGGVRVLGFCSGAQVLAGVLGARLYRLAEPEIGWVRVTSKHPGLAEGPWPSWHIDAFDLPTSATELAVNEVCLQGFTAGPHAAGPFHPEATQPTVASWL